MRDSPPGPRPARKAREAAGLTLAAAASRARISPAYLARVERHGAPFVLAERLARLYGCPIDRFLPTPGGGTPGKGAGGSCPSRPRRRGPTPETTKPPARCAGGFPPQRERAD